ncbi:hypothetical protein CR513_16753, partial [Mucuna pruriens]
MILIRPLTQTLGDLSLVISCFLDLIYLISWKFKKQMTVFRFSSKNFRVSFISPTLLFYDDQMSLIVILSKKNLTIFFTKSLDLSIFTKFLSKLEMLNINSSVLE